jgi:hypothetical protein
MLASGTQDRGFAPGFFMNGEKSTARRTIGHERTIGQKVHETNKIGQKKKKRSRVQNPAEAVGFFQA